MTDPAPGTQVKLGSTITLNVLQKKQKKKDDGAQVPNVIGQTLATAAQTPASAGYTNVAVQGSNVPTRSSSISSPVGEAAPTPPRGSH